MKSVVIFSGGMDSATALYRECEDRWTADGASGVLALSFDYGQRHRKELEFASALCKSIGIEHAVVDLRSLASLLPGNALTGDVPVPHGHYAAPTMIKTVVPNRNAIMLSVAFAVAAANGATRVVTGVHAGDHAIYPDCRPEFVETFALMESLSLSGVAMVELVTPFVRVTKTDIVREGHRLGVPWASTWSCYEGGELHCGQCGTCVERREAFRDAGVVDPTEYAV